MNNLLKRKIDKHKVISFDIFDTSLLRNVSKPSDVFKIIEKNLNISNFSIDRLSLEYKASKNINKKYPNIYEIYDEYGKKEIAEYEIDVERNILVSNNEILDVYNYCLSKNKTIIFTSDMYLTSDILKDILTEKGYRNINKIFVSCEYNASKGDGTLYDKVISELNCKPSDILHIGDSLKGDFLSAKNKGLDAFLYKTKKNNNKSLFLEENIFENFIFNKHINGSNGYIYGYKKLGILLYSFSNWLNTQFKKNKIEKVFFLSRDGYIMKEVFDKIKDKNIISKYLYVSRRSLTVPNLWCNSDFDDLDKNITMTNYFNIKTFIKRLGLNYDDLKKEVDECNIDVSYEFSGKNFKNDDKLHKFYDRIKDRVVANSKSEQELLIKYLKENDFFGKIAIVDIGWHGTMQRNIEKICKNAAIDIDLKGFYLGQEKIIKNGFGFLFNENDNLQNKIALAGSFGLFESFFLAHHGTVIKYEKKNDKIIPVLGEYEFKDNPDDLLIINEIQKGAIDFCNDFSKNKYLNKLDYSNLFFKPVMNLLINPTYDDVKYLGNIIFNDTNNTKLLVNKSLWYYCFHLKEFKKDFFKCVWKIGFMKKVLLIKIPYFKIYYALKSREKR